MSKADPRALALPRRQPATTPWRLARDVDNRLNAIRGYCEVARMKGENGDDLARRMAAAIDAVDELSDLIRRLVACLRSPVPRRDPKESWRSDA